MISGKALFFRAGVVCLAWVAFQAPGVWGQDTSSQPNELPAEDAADDLGKLLDMVDEDFSQVSNVNVMAPALEVEVSTVSRQESTVGRSPAAVFVVTNEMIRRSGARSIPEILRMVPGVNVARIDANKWAVTIRGFNGRFANKLLVQIDGRSVYTPLFGGTYWDVQDVVLEDVERIEVIRGPGATVWGANAVNGIINVITKSAKETQGLLVQGGAGTEERGFTTARVGGRAGKNLHWRTYGKWFDRDRAFVPSGQAHDDWRMGRAGFRADWEPSRDDTLTFQGDYYTGAAGRSNLLSDPNPPAFVRQYNSDDEVRGGHAQMRWTRILDEDSDWSAQFYYDRTERDWENIGFTEDRETVDFDFQHRFRLGDRHRMIWGFGYRNTRDQITNVPFVLDFDPASRADDTFSYFIQDEITLAEDRLYFTVGSKFEHNDYTSFEFQPTGRLLWTPDQRHSIWASISRAVHPPIRASDDARFVLLPSMVPSGPPPAPMIPMYPYLSPNPGLQSEDLLAYEAGIRVQPTDAFFWDLSVFFHKYEDLASFAPGFPAPGPGQFPALFLPLMQGNELSGETYGFELAANYQINDRWRIYGAYSFLQIALHGSPALIAGNEDGEGTAPHNQLYIQSAWDIRSDWQFDLTWRYTDVLPAVGVPSYNVMDARLAWRPTPHFEAAVVGRNLLDPAHPEAGNDTYTGTFRTEVQQEAYGMVTWRY